MYHFHASIHARPDDCQPGPPLEAAGERFATCSFRPSGWARARSRRSFEEVAAELARLERMYIEPDGSFVWVSSHGEAALADRWQFARSPGAGAVGRRQGKLPGRAIRPVARRRWAGRGRRSYFNWSDAAVFLDEAEFRRWALLKQGVSARSRMPVA